MFKRLPAEVVRESQVLLLSEVRKNIGNFARKHWQRKRFVREIGGLVQMWKTKPCYAHVF